RRFVEEGLVRAMEKPWAAVQWQLVLGSESFVRQVQDRIAEVRAGRGEGTALRQGRKRARPAEVLAAAARYYGVEGGERRWRVFKGRSTQCRHVVALGEVWTEPARG